MAVVKKRLGFMPCPCCGHSVAVRENEAGTLTIACDGCDISAFAKRGTEAATKWRAALPKPAPEPVPKEHSQNDPSDVPAPTPPVPAPAPKAKPAGPFDFLTARA